MPDFSYVALAGGKRSTGVVSAASEREALAQLDSRGMMALRLEALKTAPPGQGKSVNARVLAAFFSQLADLLQAGVPLLRSLELLERQTSNQALQFVLKEVRTSVADGTGLAQAMGKHPKVFGELAVSMVLAGQEGGFLEDVLRRIADFTEHQEDMKAKVIGAMAYPAVLAGLGTVILLVLILFFVPKFEQVFDRLKEKGQMPALTTGLLWVSNTLSNPLVFIPLGLVIFLGFGAFQAWSSSPKGRYQLDALRLKVPGAGRIYLSLALARFTRILGTMLSNGIPILQALRIAKDSTGNRVLAEAIEQSAENVKGGDSLATPLINCRFFPRDIVEMVSVGEESNQLEKVLVDVADGLEKRTSRELELFVRLLEPLMLVVMAGLVLLVVAGLLLPIFRMSSVIE
ncbi:MAG: type II secretion system F family protein [Planctomycetota bacterium]|jgi:general secretion pathway protein F/type IV pilus assembly protein PilC|nr:type II secretion system F family protein [Planctomycetota bacterium]